jgi:hypothetical protein
MDGALDPRDVRLERRLRIGLRLVLYPLALGLIALVWQYSHRDPPEPAAIQVVHVVHWAGVTDQGQTIRGTSSAGRFRSLGTAVLQDCSNQSPLTFRWFSGPQHFQQSGRAVRGRQAGTGRLDSGGPIKFDVRVRAQMGSDVHGTLNATTRWKTRHGAVVCDSGPVTFKLRHWPPGRTQ